MSKRVVILTAADPYRDIRAIKTAKTLCDDGYDVYLVGGKAADNFSSACPYHIYEHNKLYDPKNSTLKKLLFKFDFFQYCKKVIRSINPDVIHACNVDMLWIAHKCNIKRCSIIYDSYEICAHKSGVASSSAFIPSIIEHIEKKLLKHISYMLCVSESAKRYFIEKYGVNNISVITNVPSNTLDITEHKKNKPMVCLYIGSFTRYRGIEELILSGQYLNEQDTKIHIQGFGAYENELRQITTDNMLESKVSFVAPVQPELVLKEISDHADIGIVLTRPTSLNHKLTVSNKIFDYINAGLPVIMSNADEHKYINGKYGIGIIIEDVSPECVYQAVKKLTDDTELYDRLSNNCLKASKYLNWERESEKLIGIYESLSVKI